MVTFISVMVLLAGRPDTAMLLEAPAGLLSATGILRGPEQNCAVLGVDNTFSFMAGSPRQITAGLGVTIGAGGV